MPRVVLNPDGSTLIETDDGQRMPMAPITPGLQQLAELAAIPDPEVEPAQPLIAQGPVSPASPPQVSDAPTLAESVQAIGAGEVPVPAFEPTRPAVEEVGPAQPAIQQGPPAGPPGGLEGGPRATDAQQPQLVPPSGGVVAVRTPGGRFRLSPEERAAREGIFEGLAGQEAGLAQQQQVAARTARAVGEASDEAQQAAEALRERFAEQERERQEDFDQALGVVRQFVEDSQEQVDRGRMFRGDGRARVMAAIGLALSAAGRAFGATPQQAPMDIIENAIQRDIEIQERELERRGRRAGQAMNLLELAFRRTQDVRAGRAAGEAALWNEVDRVLASLAAQSGNAAQIGALEQLRGRVRQQASAVELEFVQQDAARRRRAAAGRTRFFITDEASGQLIPATRSQAIAEATRRNNALQEQRQSIAERVAAGEEITNQEREIFGRDSVRTLRNFTNIVAQANRQVVAAGGRDIPGFGTLQAATRGVPLVGEVVADVFTTTEGQQLRQNLAMAGAMQVFLLSGKQTNESEVRRIADALEGRLRTPAQLRGFLAQLNRTASSGWDAVRARTGDRIWNSVTAETGDPREGLLRDLSAERLPSDAADLIRSEVQAQGGVVRFSPTVGGGP